MLTKKTIVSGEYVEAFANVHRDILWSREEIDASLSEALEARPESGEVWLFGYGSIIWNPLLEYDAREAATLHGWHRSFCLRTIVGRGCLERPGRMLSLERGGFVRGVVLRVTKNRIADELRTLWIREMVTGAYTPTWADLRLPDGRDITALVFTAKPTHPFYEPDTDVLKIAPLVAVASGLMGTNADYVHRLQAALSDCNVQDPYVDDLVAELHRLSTA